MIKKLYDWYTALYADDGVLVCHEDSGDVTFSWNKMGTLSVNLHNINLDTNFDEDDFDAIIFIRILACHSEFKKRKALKKR